MKRLIGIVAASALMASAATAQQHGHGMQHGASGSALPLETGEAAFAAIQEIVAMLEADPATDWSKVDIEALRSHLIDMNNVTLRSAVRTISTDRSVTFEVSGEGAVRDSIRRMIVSQARTLNGRDGWVYAATLGDHGASLTITPPDPALLTKVRALGYIGMVSRGAHHQHHHLMLAKGMAPH